MLRRIRAHRAGRYASHKGIRHAPAGGAAQHISRTCSFSHTWVPPPRGCTPSVGLVPVQRTDRPGPDRALSVRCTDSVWTELRLSVQRTDSIWTRPSDRKSNREPNERKAPARCSGVVTDQHEGERLAVAAVTRAVAGRCGENAADKGADSGWKRLDEDCGVRGRAHLGPAWNRHAIQAVRLCAEYLFSSGGSDRVPVAPDRLSPDGSGSF